MPSPPPEVRRAAVTLGAAVGVFSVSFGVVRPARLSVPMACAMSIFVFTGATQFAAVGVIDSGGSALAALGSGLLRGALFGDALGDPETLGLDAVFPAAFRALLVPFLRRRDGRAASIATAAIGLALVPFAPAGVPIVAAAAGALVGLFFASPQEADTPPPTEEPA